MSAAQHIERALGAWLAWNGDPRAEARRAVEADPDCAPAQLLETQLLLCSRHPEDWALARQSLARAHALPLDARERLHAAVAAAALAGDYARSRALLGHLLGEYPRDLLALLVAHTMDHILGDAVAQRAQVAAVLPAWSASDPGYHGVLAMHAFALEENGEYGRAEEAALAALALEPASLRAMHARAHVMEMQGRAAQGLRWLQERAAQWDHDGASATHLRWHRALYLVELGDLRGALAAYERIALGESLSEMIDASALLWRIELRGADTGARWAPLAARWAARAEDAFCPFNDLHAMLAFVGAGRRDLQKKLLHAQRRRLARGGGGVDVEMLRFVGQPACLALAACGAGAHERAAQILRGLPAVSHRLGGSHAQRGLLGLTLRSAEKRIGVRARFSAPALAMGAGRFIAAQYPEVAGL